MSKEINARQIDLRAIAALLNEVSGKGDFTRAAEILGENESTPRAYISGRRNVETDKGIQVVNIVSRVTLKRLKDEQIERIKRSLEEIGAN